jgi:hypothetical protein
MLRDRLHMQYRSSSKAKLARKKAEQKKAPELNGFSPDIVNFVPSVGFNSPAKAIRSSQIVTKNHQSAVIFSQPLNKVSEYEGFPAGKTGKVNFDTSFSNENDKSLSSELLRNPPFINQSPFDYHDQELEQQRTTTSNAISEQPVFDCDDLPDDISGIFED